MNQRSFIIVIITTLFMITFVFANPKIEILPTTTSVEKGSEFQLRVKITAVEPLQDIVISPIIPEGFKITPIASPGIETVKPDRSETGDITIAALEAGSSLTVSFRVHTPGYSDSPRKRNGEFVFNVFYLTQKDTLQVKGSETCSINIEYTTSIGFYLLAGLLGVILGHIVKVATKDRATITSAAQNEISIMKKLFIVGRHLFISQLPGLITILAIGFGVLLTLAREAVPVRGWPEAIALGIGLAVLTDEELLMKIKA